jgi:hypothetical protein
MQRVTPLTIKFIVFPAQGFAFIHNDFSYSVKATKVVGDVIAQIN